MNVVARIILDLVLRTELSPFEFLLLEVNCPQLPLVLFFLEFNQISINDIVLFLFELLRTNTKLHNNDVILFRCEVWILNHICKCLLLPLSFIVFFPFFEMLHMVYTFLLCIKFQNFNLNPYFEDTELTKTFMFFDDGSNQIWISLCHQTGSM